MSGFNLFNNEQRSGYEELMSYYPIFYRDVREMDAILHICGHMLDGMASAMEAIVLNRFIDTMDEEATARMEAFLYLTGNRGRPLGERKRLIHALLVGHGKMSASKIKEVVEVFTGLPAEVDFIKEYIAIRVPLAGHYQFYLADIKSTLGKRMPAHLAFYFSFLIGKIVTKECFKLRRILNRTAIYWFGDGDFWMLNGIIFLDGSRLLNARFPPYNIRIWIKTKISSANQVVPYRTDNKSELLLKEKFSSSICHTYTFYWSGDLIDYQKMKVIHRFTVRNRETVSAPIVTTKHNLWYLNGTVPLDGQQTLDAYQIKEVW